MKNKNFSKGLLIVFILLIFFINIISKNGAFIGFRNLGNIISNEKDTFANENGSYKNSRKNHVEQYENLIIDDEQAFGENIDEKDNGVFTKPNEERPTVIEINEDSNDVNSKKININEISEESEYRFNVTLSVDCSTILNNIEKFNKDKLEVLPENGTIYTAKDVEFQEGDSVFDILLREMRRSKIHVDFVTVPPGNNSYVKGINNIYEFDCGELSGWVYRVNGLDINYGAEQYEPISGDIIKWVYTCDLGRDIGGEKASFGGDQ